MDKIATPVAFVIVGLIMIVVGAVGVIPVGNPQPTITEPIFKIVLVVLGVLLVLLGPLFVWRELNLAKAATIATNDQTASQEVTERKIPRASEISPRANPEHGVLAGKWEQVIYDNKSRKNIIKRDLVECSHIGEVVEADISRFYPEDQKGRKWHFAGRFRQGRLFGHFWSDVKEHLSFGTIYLRHSPYADENLTKSTD